MLRIFTALKKRLENEPEYDRIVIKRWLSLHSNQCYEYFQEGMKERIAMGEMVEMTGIRKIPRKKEVVKNVDWYVKLIGQIFGIMYGKQLIDVFKKGKR